MKSIIISFCYDMMTRKNKFVICTSYLFFHYFEVVISRTVHAKGDNHYLHYSYAYTSGTNIHYFIKQFYKCLVSINVWNNHYNFQLQCLNDLRHFHPEFHCLSHSALFFQLLHCVFIRWSLSLTLFSPSRHFQNLFLAFKVI